LSYVTHIGEEAKQKITFLKEPRGVPIIFVLLKSTYFMCKIGLMSKMRSSGIWSKHMPVSQTENLLQGVKFVLFSASAGIIQALTFTMLNELLHWPYWPCYLIALTLSVLWNFTLNREFTFKSTTNVPKAMLKIAIYYAIFTPLSTWWGVALTNMGWNEYIVLFGTMLINMATEFLVCRFLVYRDSMNTNQRDQRSAAMVQK
jgi:putative flippase GtrA